MEIGSWDGVPRFIPPKSVGTEPAPPEPEIRYVPCDLPGPGQGFQVDPARLRNIASKWEELAEGFRLDQNLADRVIAVEGPAPDYASQNNAAMISRSGQALKDALINRQQFCSSQAQKYLKLADQYEKFDEDSSRRLREIGSN